MYGDVAEVPQTETTPFRPRSPYAAAKLYAYWERYVRIDPRYYRPTEVDLLIGDATKARKALGWAPSVRFKELVALMVDADLTML